MDKAIAIAVTHKSYLTDFCSTFIECVTKRYGEMVNESSESDPLTLVKDRLEFDKYFLDFENILIHNLASMMNTILSFRRGLTCSCDFEDEESVRFHLLRLVNNVLGMAKETIDNTDRNEGVDYAVVLGEIYYMAAGSSYNIENSVGCTAETDLPAKINLLTTHTLADSLAKQNHTLN